MKPVPFDYQAPDSLEGALALLAGGAAAGAPPAGLTSGETAVLAGGQSLLPLLNARERRPSLLVDLRRVPGLDAIADGDPLVLGAMVRHRTVEHDPLVAERAPLLAAAARHVASTAIRARGTLGGSLAHADPGAELPAALAALGATVVVRSSLGERRVAAAALARGPFDAGFAPGELIVAVEVPAASASRPWGFSEVARFHGGPAQAGAAAVLGACGERVRLALFAVGARPVVVEGAVDELRGGELPVALEPPRDPEHRRALARVVAARAVEQALERAGGKR